WNLELARERPHAGHSPRRRALRTAGRVGACHDDDALVVDVEDREMSALIVVILALLAQAPAVPQEIPIFPLPETSLFPGVSRPFLIYEPRYREMIADALKGNKIIGMVRLRPGFEKDYE